MVVLEIALKMALGIGATAMPLPTFLQTEREGLSWKCSPDFHQAERLSTEP